MEPKEPKDILLTFYNNCRICLDVHQQMTPIQLLKESSDFNMLLTYFNIEIMTDTRYPNKICIDCLNQLSNTIIFKQKCESTFVYLKNILNDSVFKVLPFQDLNVFDEPIKTEEQEENSSEKDTNTDEKCQEAINNNINIEELGTESFFCKKCNYNRQTCNCIDSHTKSEPGESETEKTKSKIRFKCQHCEKTFKTTYHQQRHEATHLKSLFKCDRCPKLFRKQDLLTRHIRIHMGQKPFVCTECSRSFSGSSSLAVHKRVNHSTNPPPKVICNKCGQSVKNLFIHNRYKHSTYEFECQYCTKKFPFKSVLITHVKDFHENSEESFKILCTLCGKKFRQVADLNRHNTVNHSEERNYPCRFCDKRFKTSSVRAKHQRIHLDDRRFKCTYCSKGFTQSKILVNHIRTHTGEKPFSCSICSKAFRQNATLGTHIKLVHGQALTVKK